MLAPQFAYELGHRVQLLEANLQAVVANLPVMMWNVTNDLHHHLFLCEQRAQDAIACTGKIFQEELEQFKASHATLADRLAYIEQLMEDSFDKRAQELAAAVAKMDAMHGRVSEERVAREAHVASLEILKKAHGSLASEQQALEKHHATLEERLDYLEKEQPLSPVPTTRTPSPPASPEDDPKAAAKAAWKAAAAAVASKEETKSQVQTLQQELKVAEELCRSAEAKQKEASTLQLQAEQRATEAEKAYLAVEERELRAKAELKSQSQEAHRLTEKCALLSQEKAELEEKVQQKLISQEQAEQSLMAKKAEFEVLQETLKTLQDSNRTLRDERAAAYAASEEATSKGETFLSVWIAARADIVRLKAIQSEDEKRRAYKKLLLKYHPDKNQHNQEVMTRVYQEVFG